MAFLLKILQVLNLADLVSFFFRFRLGTFKLIFRKHFLPFATFNLYVAKKYRIAFIGLCNLQLYWRLFFPINHFKSKFLVRRKTLMNNQEDDHINKIKKLLSLELVFFFFNINLQNLCL